MLQGNTIDLSVRSYFRDFPDEFDGAHGAKLFAKNDREYMGFIVPCGSLNYGHNHDTLAKALGHYVANRGVAFR